MTSEEDNDPTQTTDSSGPIRKCPNCGATHATYRGFCPSCGKRYDRPFARLSDRGRWLVGITLLLILVGVAIWLVPTFVTAKNSAQAHANHIRNAEISALRKQIIQQQTPHYGKATIVKQPTPGASASVQIAGRVTLVGEVKHAILNDARQRARSGQLDGPILTVTCNPLIPDPTTGSDELDLTKKLGRYDCVAEKRPVASGGKVVASYGYPFVATVDFTKFTYVWCRDYKAPGERGIALVQVPLDRVCLGAEGAPRVGNGYALPKN